MLIRSCRSGRFLGRSGDFFGEGSRPWRAGAAGLRRTGPPSKRAGELRAGGPATHSKRAISLDRAAPGNIWILYHMIPAWGGPGDFVKNFYKNFLLNFLTFDFWQGFFLLNFLTKNLRAGSWRATEPRSHGSPLNTGELRRSRGGILLKILTN